MEEGGSSLAPCVAQVAYAWHDGMTGSLFRPPTSKSLGVQRGSKHTERLRSDWALSERAAALVCSVFASQQSLVSRPVPCESVAASLPAVTNRITGQQFFLCTPLLLTSHIMWGLLLTGLLVCGGVALAVWGVVELARGNWKKALNQS